MSYILVIVESPAKCKKIENFLGLGYKCVACFGHIRELKSIDISNNFFPKYNLIKKKISQISKIKDMIQRANEIIIATDNDREGESIAWHICETFKLNIQTTKRIIFNEITKSAVINAVNNPIKININLVKAQQSRQILDALVGYKISPILWDCFKCEDVKDAIILSAGRCQIPALKLIYDNHIEIKNTEPKQNYNINGYFTKLMLKFSLENNFDDIKDVENFLEESVNFQHVYTYNEPITIIKLPPLPFTTSTIQQVINTKYHISPKDTMIILQKLYEDGFITYIRTDNKKYSIEFIEKAKLYISEKFGNIYIYDDIYKLENKYNEDVKIQDVKPQEAHEAIRPTDILINELPNTYTSDEIRIYKLIWSNTLESCMSSARYNSITACITAPYNNIYKYNTEQNIFPGWLIVSGIEKADKSFIYLQSIKKDSILNYKRINSIVSFKDIIYHYNESNLIQFLESKGIGRPSTYSSLIDKIQDRLYVTKQNIQGKKIKCKEFELIDDELSESEVERVFGDEKKKLVITPIGIKVCEFLYKFYNEIFKYDYTKYMEDVLDIIANGNKLWYDLCFDCNVRIDSLTKNVNTNYSYSDSNNINLSNILLIKNKRLKSGVNKTNKTNKFTKNLGKYENQDLILKEGSYGLYVVWGDNKKSIKEIRKDKNDITLDDVLVILKKPFLTTYLEKNNEYDNNIIYDTNNIQNVKNNIIRHINKELSIRNSKYGDYIFYKTLSMSKPRFLKLKGYEGDYNNDTIETILSWIRNTHNI